MKNSQRLLRENRLNQKGQLVFEYVLMLVVSVTIATFITSSMVSRNADSPGFLIGKWQQMLEAIGRDYPDGQNPQ